MEYINHNQIMPEPEDSEAINRVINSGYWAYSDETRAAEEALSGITGNAYCHLVSSGLSALRLALIALGVKENDHVLVPAYSCVAIPNAVLALGAKPVPVDCEENTSNISADDLCEKYTDACKAVIAVNTFGEPADIQSIKDKTGLPVIEDCAHGFGLSPLATQGDMVTFSFYATKFIGAGECGAVACNDEAFAETVADFRDYTDKAPDGRRLNDKPNDIQAALLGNRLKYLQTYISKRAELAARYLTGIDMSYTAGTRSGIWYRFIVRTEDPESAISYLESKNIGAAIPVENWLSKEQLQQVPNAARAYQRNLSLPLYPTLNEQTQDYIIKSVNSSKLFS